MGEEIKTKKPFYKKWWVWVIAVIALFIIWPTPKSSTEVVKKDVKTESTKKEQKKEEKVYKVGETINVNDEMEVTINSVKLTNERNQFSKKNPKQVAVIDYTYKNLVDKELFISNVTNFKIYDEEGNILERYPAGCTKHSQKIGKDKQCNTDMSYGFNEGTKLEICFYRNSFNGKEDFKVIADVEQ